MAVSTNILYIPHGLLSGGIAGIALMLHYLFKFQLRTHNIYLKYSTIHSWNQIFKYNLCNSKLDCNGSIFYHGKLFTIFAR